VQAEADEKLFYESDLPQYRINLNKQVGQLSQANRAACISFGKNISAKSMHLITSLNPTALTSTNDYLTDVLRHYVCT